MRETLAGSSACPLVLAPSAAAPNGGLSRVTRIGDAGLGSLLTPRSGRYWFLEAATTACTTGSRSEAIACIVRPKYYGWPYPSDHPALRFRRPRLNASRNTASTRAL